MSGTFTNGLVVGILAGVITSGLSVYVYTHHIDHTNDYISYLSDAQVKQAQAKQAICNTLKICENDQIENLFAGEVSSKLEKKLVFNQKAPIPGQ